MRYALRQSMGVTEPTTGTDTTKLKTTAVKRGDRYVVNGQKVWISRVQHSDLMILLARTTPLAEVKRKSEGMSIFIGCSSGSTRPWACASTCTRARAPPVAPDPCAALALGVARKALPGDPLRIATSTSTQTANHSAARP
jgi:hypothetical protein